MAVLLLCFAAIVGICVLAWVWAGRKYGTTEFIPPEPVTPPAAPPPPPATPTDAPWEENLDGSN